MFNNKQSINIKLASVKDTPDLLTIQKGDNFNHAYFFTEERIKRLMKKGELFYLAIINQLPVGFISVDIELRAKIHFLSVLRNFQNQGIGTALLSFVLNKTRKFNCKSIYAYVEINSGVERFLLKRGFKKVGFFENRYEEGRDANILAKDLTKN